MALAYFPLPVCCHLCVPEFVHFSQYLLGSLFALRNFDHLMLPVSRSWHIWNLVVTEGMLLFPLLCLTSLSRTILPTEYIWGNFYFSYFCIGLVHIINLKWFLKSIVYPIFLETIHIFLSKRVWPPYCGMAQGIIIVCDFERDLHADYYYLRSVICLLLSLMHISQP